MENDKAEYLLSFFSVINEIVSNNKIEFQIPYATLTIIHTPETV